LRLCGEQLLNNSRLIKPAFKESGVKKGYLRYLLIVLALAAITGLQRSAWCSHPQASPHLAERFKPGSIKFARSNGNYQGRGAILPDSSQKKLEQYDKETARNSFVWLFGRWKDYFTQSCITQQGGFTCSCHSK
jgi:hypothetical protein